MKNCVKCKQQFEETTDKGRSRLYCSIACRRSAELEIRRINERLLYLEREIEAHRIGDPMAQIYGNEKNLLIEIDRQENRLRELLAGMNE